MWGWISSMGGTCGFGPQQQKSAMWVRATPELSPQDVPGMSDDLLGKICTDGGNIEEKIQCVIETFRCSARHLESLQTLLRRKAVDKRVDAGFADTLPDKVRDVISQGLYTEDILKTYDEQRFALYQEEIVPNHEYRLALEIHSGGAYWSSIPTQDDTPVVHKVETVTSASPVEGSSAIVAQFGSAQRGAVFVWRWHHLPERGPYCIPPWLEKVLTAEGNDPLRKLQTEIESIRRWEQQVRNETAQHVKTGQELTDIYIREVLKLWPTEIDPQGYEQLKKCAWVEGLDSKLFCGRNVNIHRVPFDDCHTLLLKAAIAKRHVEQDEKGNSPPYRLTTTWQWVMPQPLLCLSPEAPQQAARPSSLKSLSSLHSFPMRQEVSRDAHESASSTPAPVRQTALAAVERASAEAASAATPAA
eukprot:TRINITY_DN56531_c0_g1_i1.p1 TRINITY_DN56531_c0_g1~~TRINITY_DN56531_c0_g1_i1.p1  ORF type:complete len:416 (+),score=61.44 TRINITY_DN56531_c0_g1_i1:62-1309(+)